MVEILPQFFIFYVVVFTSWQKISKLPLSDLHKVVADSLKQCFDQGVLLLTHLQQRVQNFLVVGKVDPLEHGWTVCIKSWGCITLPRLQAGVELVNVHEEVEVVDTTPKKAPVGACDSKVQQTQYDQVAVDDIAAAVGQHTFQLLVLFYHVGSQEVLDVLTVVVEACCCLEEVVEAVLAKAGDS